MSYTQIEVNDVISRSISSEKEFDSIVREAVNTPFVLHTVHAIGANSRINTYTVFPRDVNDIPDDLSLDDDSDESKDDIDNSLDITDDDNEDNRY